MLRADGIPLYNFGCVVDDHAMDITLVVRGQEHINSTFPQLLLYRALGWTPPAFAHLPLILGPDREKLSKRRHPEADVMLHKRNGILPEALLNFIVRLGWSHGNDEVISREQMIQWFGFDHVGSTSGVWNPEKLLWLNQHYLKTLPETDVAQRLVPFLAERAPTPPVTRDCPRVVVALRERSKTLVEMAELARPFFVRPEMDPKAAAKHLTTRARRSSAKAREALAAGDALDCPRPGPGAQDGVRDGGGGDGEGRPAGPGRRHRDDGQPADRGDARAPREGRVAGADRRGAAVRSGSRDSS